MISEKILMSEVAALYYRKNLTQQQIAQTLQLSRQTVSRLLNDAIDEGLVEIIIHDPQEDHRLLQQQLCGRFGIRNAVICSVSGRNEDTRQLMTVRAAVAYIRPLLQRGHQRIALSWGRTVRAFIKELPETPTEGNTVFPLFGATDNEHACFSSNELARQLAGKLNATPKCAWFPYLADNDGDYALLKQLSYYRDMQALWDSADLAIMGVGNREILDVFGKAFGYNEIHAQAVGDVSTHFFDPDGRLLSLYPNTLCASADNLRNTKQTIAIACGREKVEAIAGALRTGLIHTLITDEHTAAQLLTVS